MVNSGHSGCKYVYVCVEVAVSVYKPWQPLFVGMGTRLRAYGCAELNQVQGVWMC